MSVETQGDRHIALGFLCEMSLGLRCATRESVGQHMRTYLLKLCSRATRRSPRLINACQSQTTAYPAPSSPVWKRAAPVTIYGANHPTGLVALPALCACVTSFEVRQRGCCPSHSRAYNQACLTPFSRLVTGMLCVLVTTGWPVSN